MLEALLGLLIVAVVTTTVQHLLVGRHVKAAREQAEHARLNAGAAHDAAASAAGSAEKALDLLRPAVAQLPKTRRKKAAKADGDAGGPDLSGVA